MSNELESTLQVFTRKDGLINLYIWHPHDSWSGYRKYRERNKPFINWIRRKFPHVLNEFRKIPRTWNMDHGYGQNYDGTFAAYGLTKNEYLLIKLSWSYKEMILHNKMRKGKPVKKGNFFGAGSYARPSSACVARWKSETFRQKPLKLA